MEWIVGHAPLKDGTKVKKNVQFISILRPKQTQEKLFTVCLQEFLNFDVLILNLTCRNKVNKYDKKGFISAKEGTFVNEIFVNFFESLLTKLGNVAYLWEMSQIFR